MSDAALIRLCRTIVGVGAALAAVGAVAAAATGQLDFWWRSFGALAATVAWAFGAFAWLAIRSQPRNAAVWSMAASVGLAIFSAGLGLVSVLQDAGSWIVLADGRVPAEAPAGAAWVLALAHGCSIPGLYIPLIYGLLFFPDGRLQTRGARGIAVIAAPLIVIAGVGYGWSFRPGNTSPEGQLELGALLGLVVCTAASMVDLAVRFRASAGLTRLQYKWVAWGTALAVLVFGTLGLLPDAVVREDPAIAAGMLAALGWVVAYGVALIRYRVYDIDLVISRTLVYAGLVAAVSVAYIIVVAGLGTWIGGSDLWLSVGATALIAIVFEPTRAGLQRAANRVVYGRSATPHAVLADLTARLALAEDPRTLLVRLADGLRAGTGARRTAVWLTRDGGIEPIAVAEEPTADPDAPALQPVTTVDHLPGAVVRVAQDDGARAYLTTEEAPGMALEAADRRLAEDLAAAAGLVVRRIRLEGALRATADELAESRLRLARAEDAELSRLGAELEDSVGPLVEALPAEVDRASRVARSEGARRVSELLEAIAREAIAATEQIRSLAHGLYPRVLSSEGLAGAARTLVAASGLRAAVEIDIGGRHGRAVESAAYFCLAEALTNAAKHAREPVTIRVSDAGGELVFSVTDAGPGFDPGGVVRGSGLHNMDDRVDMLGGVVSISSRPGGSTTVRGVIPLRSAAPGIAPAS